MAVPILIKLTTTGPSITGPFSIYCTQSGNPVNPPLLTGITKAQLVAGFYMVLPSGCSGVRVLSNGVDCTNYIDFELTPTTTTTTSPPCRCHEVEISGDVTLSWTDCDGTQQSFQYSDITINVCARVGSITKTGGTGSISITTLLTSCTKESDCWPSLNLSAVGIDRFMIRQLQIWGAPYTTTPNLVPWMIDYGDGFTASFTGTQAFINGGPADHTYTGLFTGTIKIKVPSLELIKVLVERITGQSFSTGTVTLVGTELIKLENISFLQNLRWEVNAGADQIPANIDDFYSLNGTITGTVSQLPSTMTHITLLGDESNTLSGSIADFPTGMTSIRIDGSNNIGGSLSSLPASFDNQLVKFIINGDNTIDGNLSELSTYTALKEFEVKGFNEITGTLCGNFTNIIERIVITGYSNPSGNTNCITTWTNLVTLILENDDALAPPAAGNTLTGDIADLPDSLKTIIIRGKNTLNGDIVDMPTGILVDPTAKIFWLVAGENTITGDITDIRTNCNYFYHAGDHTLFGDIANIPANMIRFYISYRSGGSADLSGINGDIALMPHTQLTQFVLYGNHQVNTYSTTTVWPAGINIFIVHPTVNRATYALPTAHIDRLINDLAVTTWLVSTSFLQNELDLCGTPSALSAAGLAILNAIPPPNDINITIGP